MVSDGMADVAGATELLAEYVISTQFEPSARKSALDAVVDTVAVAVAGTADPEAQAVLGVLGPTIAEGESTAIGLWRKASHSGSALINGALAHILDYDDVSSLVKGHPSVVLVPALIALGESGAATGAALLDAYLAGFHASVAIGRGFDLSAHYRRGWHASSTVGLLGAAGACARLLGMDLRQTRQVLGMAASFVGGSRQNFGTTTKALHAGRAAEAAVLAAVLVADGASADPAQLEGRFGFFALLGEHFDETGLVGALSEGPADGLHLATKRYPCCYHGHRALEASRLLRDSIAGDEIVAVEVAVQPGGSESLIHHRPSTGLEAKFSGEYIVAVGLLDESIGLSTFTDEQVARPEIQELGEKVHIYETSVPPTGPSAWESGFAVVEIALADGRRLAQRVDHPRGSPSLPLSVDERQGKFADCLAFAGLEDVGASVQQLLSSWLEDGPVRGIFDPLSASAHIPVRRSS